MVRTVRLRAWQKAAFDRFVAATGDDFLAVATPGAGKTTFALTAARHQLAARPSRLVVVAPTAHLKLQWAKAAAAFSLHLDPLWSPAAGALPADMHGIVTSYQQVASSANALARLSAGAFVVLDELHHAGDERAWGAAVKTAFAGSGRRLALSGTPFRSDTRAIPFVSYRGEEAVPDFEYGYADALGDRGVVRPVYFPRTNGEMEWSASDGSVHTATFDDRLSAERAGQRLRTALSLEGDWLPTVLGSANERLTEIRREHPDAGGLVIAIDREHARGIAALIRTRFGATARLVTSDDPGASAEIADFATARDPWLVAVRMVSEGVDIPRLRVGVYATTTTTELFFRQAVGRLVRWTARCAAAARVVLHPRRPEAAQPRRARRRAAAPLSAPRRHASRGRRTRRGRRRRRRADVALRGDLGRRHERRRARRAPTPRSTTSSTSRPPARSSSRSRLHRRSPAPSRPRTRTTSARPAASRSASSARRTPHAPASSSAAPGSPTPRSTASSTASRASSASPKRRSISSNGASPRPSAGSRSRSRLTPLAEDDPFG